MLSRNYASNECGAKVIAANPEAEGTFKVSSRWCYHLHDTHTVRLPPTFAVTLTVTRPALLLLLCVCVTCLFPCFSACFSADFLLLLYIHSACVPRCRP